MEIGDIVRVKHNPSNFHEFNINDEVIVTYRWKSGFIQCTSFELVFPSIPEIRSWHSIDQDLKEEWVEKIGNI